MTMVKRKNGALAPKPKPKRKGRKPRVKEATLSSSLQLPTEKSEVETDLGRYSILVYGPPKIGKTSFLASFPDALFFFFEIGGKGQEVYKFPPDQECVETWEQFQRGIDLLEKTDQFLNVVIDTGAAAYQSCSKYVCRTLGIDSPGNDKTGKRDRSGMGWRALEDEFRLQINRILATGRGIHFTAHSKAETIETRSGAEFSRIVPRFTGQCERIIVPLVDHIFFIDYYRLTSGGVARVLLTKGDDLVVAGHKSGKVAVMPRFVLLPEDEPDRDYEVISAAFRGELDGLRPEDLKTSAATSDAGAQALEGAKNAAAKDRIAQARGGAAT